MIRGKSCHSQLNVSYSLFRPESDFGLVTFTVTPDYNHYMANVPRNSIGSLACHSTRWTLTDFMCSNWLRMLSLFSDGVCMGDFSGALFTAMNRRQEGR